MLFCNPWRQQQQQEEDRSRDLVFESDQDHYFNQNSQGQLPQEHGEPTSVPNNSIDPFTTPIKKTKTSTNTDPITMFFFGHNKDDKKKHEAADASTPETVATQFEEEPEPDGDTSDNLTPLSAIYPSTSDQQTPMIRMKNFFATPFVPREEQPSATKTGESEVSSLAIDTSQNLESADSSDSADNWLPLEKEASFLSRALNFDALLSTKNGEVETVEKEEEKSSPFKFLAILTILILIALSANNTRQLVQERRQVFRSAQAASVPPAKAFVEESVKTAPEAKPAPESSSSIPSFQDMVDKSSAAKAESATMKPDSATEKTSFDLSSLLFWRTPVQHKEKFFPWVDESVVKARAWTVKTLKETHQRLLNLADFLQAHKEDREVRRLVWRDELHELKAAKGW